MKPEYKLNIKNDLCINKDFQFYLTPLYILKLPKGFRFYDEIIHIRGYDSMVELKKSAKRDVVPCNCNECLKG
jgi:hypothetical protein